MDLARPRRLLRNVFIAAFAIGVSPVVAGVCTIAMIGAVIAAVHHAEVVAHRVGEPFGTLVLAVAVTVIEASLVLSMMLAGGEGAAVLTRDTIYSAVMIICNGVVGLCILVGGLAHREQSFRVEGGGAALAALMTMSALSPVAAPDFTTTTGIGTYSHGQLAFAAVTSAASYGRSSSDPSRTVRHRDYFLPAARTRRMPRRMRTSRPIAKRGRELRLVARGACLGRRARQGSLEAHRGCRRLSRSAEGRAYGIAIATSWLLPETWAASPGSEGQPSLRPA